MKGSISETQRILRTFPWTKQYLSENQIEAFEERVPDAAFFTKRPDTYEHVEVIYLLNQNGELVGEVGVDDSIPPPRVWGFDFGSGPKIVNETIRDTVFRSAKKSKEATFALCLQNSTKALLFHTSDNEKLSDVAKRFRICE